MKEYDFVILTKDRQEYLEEGIKKGRYKEIKSHMAIIG